MNSGMKKALDNLLTNKTLERTQLALKALRAYHRHEVWGMGHIPTEGPALIATNHSLATYDGFMLGSAVLEKTGRLVKGLGDRLLFELPLTRKFATQVGIVNAGPGRAREWHPAECGRPCAPPNSATRFNGRTAWVLPVWRARPRCP